MTTIDRIERFIFDSSRTKFLLVIITISFVKTGIWYIPNTELSRTIADNPFTNPFSNPYSHYLFWNWFSPFLAWLIHANQSKSFVLFHLMFAISFTSLFIISIFRRLPERQARIAFVIFSAIPVSGTIYYWVGMDAVILFLMLLPLAFPRIRGLPMLAGIGMGMQHFEQGLVSGSILLVACLVSIRMRLAAPYPPAFAVAWIVGTLTGKLTLVALFAHWGVAVNDGRLTLFGHEFKLLLLDAAFHLQVVLWSTLAVGWLVLLGYVERLRRQAIPLVVGLLLCSPFIGLAGDESRVISIITFPLLAGYWFFNEGSLRLITEHETSWVFILWLMVPWSWVWVGVPRWSAFPYDLYWMFDKILGPFPAQWLEPVPLFK